MKNYLYIVSILFALYACNKSEEVMPEEELCIESLDTFSDVMARSVSISSDGSIIAYLDVASEEILVYEFNGTDWFQKGSSILGHNWAVDISCDGNRLIGTGNTTAIYSWNGAEYVKDLTIPGYGEVRISCDGNTASSGGGIFMYDDIVWSKDTVLQSEEEHDTGFGYATSLSEDGQIFALADINSNDHPNNGTVRVYKRNTSDIWEQIGEDISPITEAASNRFGSSVDLSSDGNTIAIGIPQHRYGNSRTLGAIMTFSFDGSAWSQKGNTIEGINIDDNQFGWKTRISGDGDQIIGGAHQKDFAIVYDYDGENWTQCNVITGTSNSGFGIAVDVSDNNLFVIGAVGSASNNYEGYCEILKKNN